MREDRLVPVRVENVLVEAMPAVLRPLIFVTCSAWMPSRHGGFCWRPDLIENVVPAIGT
jgi:hypothetical protein